MFPHVSCRCTDPEMQVISHVKCMYWMSGCTRLGGISRLRSIIVIIDSIIVIIDSWFIWLIHEPVGLAIWCVCMAPLYVGEGVQCLSRRQIRVLFLPYRKFLSIHIHRLMSKKVIGMLNSKISSACSTYGGVGGGGTFSYKYTPCAFAILIKNNKTSHSGLHVLNNTPLLWMGIEQGIPFFRHTKTLRTSLRRLCTTLFGSWAWGGRSLSSDFSSQENS
jgi:hypothetical protein